jgi:DUF1009 family protein
VLAVEAGRVLLLEQAAAIAAADEASIALVSADGRA